MCETHGCSALDICDHITRGCYDDSRVIPKRSRFRPVREGSYTEIPYPEDKDKFWLKCEVQKLEVKSRLRDCEERNRAS